MSLRTALLLAIAAIGTGCSDPAKPNTGWAPDVEGSWSWGRSTRDADGIDLSPATDGHTAVLTLTASAPGALDGTYTYRENGVIVGEGTYDIAFEDEPGANFIFWQPAFGRYHELTWVAVMVGDTLRLDDATTGGYTSHWGRAAILE